MANRDELNIELAWAAGFMDGEGSFMIQQGTNRYGNLQHCCKVSAAQVSRVPLEKLLKLFGGRIQEVHSPYGVEYQWYLSGVEASKCAEALMPFLVLKADRAALLVEYQKTVGGYTGKSLPEEVRSARISLCERVRTLNGKRKRSDVERLSEVAVA